MSGIRYEDWPQRLVDFIEARRRVSFKWGHNDCCLFAADCVEALTGSDPASQYRGYTTRQEAEAMLEDHGGVAGVAESSGFPEMHPHFAQRGDVVLIENNGNPALGICMGKQIAAAGLYGVVWVARSEAKRAWKI